MTEKEWRFKPDDWHKNPVYDFTPWINFLKSFASERKFRLWTVAILQTKTSGMTAPQSIKAIDAIEQYADGRLSVKAFAEIGGVAGTEAERWHNYCAGKDTAALTGSECEQATFCHCLSWATRPASVGGGLGRIVGQSIHIAPGPTILAFMHDIFGNPFRPVAFDPRWRTEYTDGLARGIYEDRAFDRLPLLADALMDAGCADEQVLGHCQSDGPHVRGCWVVDLVLGKE
jgi:hypothetical protein